MQNTVGIVQLTTPGQANELISIHTTYESAKAEADILQRDNHSLSQRYVADSWPVDQ